MDRKKLLIFGNYGSINLGDEVILFGLLKAISPKKWDITVVSSNPERTAKQYHIKTVCQPPFGFRSLLKNSFFPTIKAIKEAEIILFGGGGLFQDKEKRAFLMWSFFLRICLFFNKKVALVGNSIGPLNKSISRLQAQQLFNQLPFISVRDQDSYDLLKEIGITETKISLATDCAFFLAPIKKATQKNKPILLILHGEYTSESQIKKIKKFVQYLKNKKEKVYFLAMQKRVSNDHKMAEKLGIPLLEADSVKEIVDYISSAKFILSSRLHGIILSILASVPFLAFSEMPKVKGFLASAGLSKYFIQSNFSNQFLIKFFEQSRKQNQKIQTELKKAFKNEKSKARLILPDFI